jgi:hypothetical protein
MPGAAETAAAADRGREREHALRLIAERLREVLPRVPSSYKAGRSALLRALVGLEDLTPAQAGRLLTELTERGAVKYTTEGRGIGAAGMWTYPRATTSPANPPTRTRRRA